MRVFNLLVLLGLIAFFVSCSGGKQISSNINNGELAYQSGDYEKALAQFEEVINYYVQNDQQKECPVYGEAANAAIQLGNKEKAIDYLKKDQYSVHTTANTYYTLAGLYRELDNLSKELEELESYVSKYPQGDKMTEVQSRLFDIYVESQNWEKAEQEWMNLPDDTKSNAFKLEEYFQVNKALDNDSVCDVIATELLDIDKNNLVGLEWLAKKYFWKAEVKYASELKAYQKNKTNKQYKKLLKALDEVSADFKTSLGYFKKLYSIDPSPQYAKYLGDIYNRLDDKKKSDYYYGLSKEK